MTTPTEASTTTDTGAEAAVETSTDRAVLVSEEFKRGARAAAESMKYYFLDDNEAPIYDIPSSDLDAFTDDAITGAIYDEGMRIANGMPIV